MKNLVEPIKNKDDVLKIENALPDMYSLIWAIGTNIGLRISDIIKLKTDIVDVDYIELIEQKTGKYKRFPINKKLKNKIKNYYENIRVNQYCLNVSDAMFVGKRHYQIDRSAVYRCFNKIINELEIKGNFGTHTMRKTFGYHHYKQFKDVALLQSILNHSTPAITLRYIGIAQDEINYSYNNFCLNDIDKSCEKKIDNSSNEFIKLELVKLQKNILNLQKMLA